MQNPNGIFNTHSDDLATGGGHQHGGALHSGLNFRSAEFSLSAAYGRYLDGRLNITTDGRTIALEEAWLRGRARDSGTALKFGKFLSAVGWQNALHPHAWDFVDQPLPYQLLLAGGLGGNGAQASWEHHESSWRTKIGLEALTGGNEAIAALRPNPTAFTTTQGQKVSVPFGVRPDWPTIWTVFGRLAISPMAGQEWGANLGWVHGRMHQELHQFHPGINDADHALQGHTDTLVAGLRYAQMTEKPTQGGWDVMAEYFYQRKDLLLNFHQTKPWNIGQPRTLNADGYYVQARYRVTPSWTAGLRFDVTGHIQEALRDAAPNFCAPPYANLRCPRQNSQFEGISRRSALVDWQIDTRQSLRLQISRTHSSVALDSNLDGRMEAVNQHFTQAFLQYRLALGTPPKHHRHAD
ncbi:hypothetical protein [Halothiobacillus sp. DCM-1]|uniref:hypothetical protein n=1 Tax=Halothiobacillus sp. DCM-1 TaxID=3112558 RepID=UPI00324977E3